mmetsp:Transcript_4582/g.12325  ORF Transcript_4582/g.12325 Transcript_4582/m.12325 type:complete len:297 (+) Transcript_4582:187-1077(+)
MQQLRQLRVAPAEILQRQRVHAHDIPAHQRPGDGNLGGKLFVSGFGDPSLDVGVAPPHRRDYPLNLLLRHRAVRRRLQVLADVLLLLVRPLVLLPAADETDGFERGHRVLRVRRRRGDGADDAELRVGSDETLHQNSGQVAAPVGHVHVTIPAALLRLQPPLAHALLQRVQRRVDLRGFPPLLRRVVHVVLFPLGPRAVHQREPTGGPIRQDARQTQHRVRPGRRRVAVRRGRRPAAFTRRDDLLELSHRRRRGLHRADELNVELPVLLGLQLLELLTPGDAAADLLDGNLGPRGR